MTSGASKGLAIALLAVLLAAGGVVGFVIGKRQAVQSVDTPRASARLERFTRRLNLTDEQRAAVDTVLSETRDSVASAKASGQEKILSILDDDQKVRYQKMLERQKERRAKRKKNKKGKKKKRRRDRE